MAGWLSAAASSGPVPEAGYTVMVEVDVAADGSVRDAKVLRSENDFLSRLALSVARSWKLPVKEKEGVAVAYRAKAPVFFPVEGDEGAAADAGPKPRPREIIQPKYPLGLRQAGQAGGAILELVVEPTGRVREVTVLRASHPEFGSAARQAVRTWRFYPAEADGKKVEVRVRMAVVFELEGIPADWRWVVPPRPAIPSYVITGAAVP